MSKTDPLDDLSSVEKAAVVWDAKRTHADAVGRGDTAQSLDDITFNIASNPAAVQDAVKAYGQYLKDSLDIGNKQGRTPYQDSM